MAISRTAIAALRCALVLCPALAGAFEVELLSTHLYIQGIKSVQPPAVVDESLILSMQGPFRSVGAAFEHEGYATVHYYERNIHGVFILAYAIPLETRSPLRYRVVVDGAWSSDPSNPDKAFDARSGRSISLATVPFISAEKRGSYRILGDGGMANFHYRAAEGLSVALAGDFNGWDCFIHILRETEPGLYELSLPLAPGVHFYYFVIYGDKVADPLNPDRVFDRSGQEVSVLRVP